jgi:hypothetical protein
MKIANTTIAQDTPTDQRGVDMIRTTTAAPSTPMAGS